MSLAPASLVANSNDPRMSLFSMLPATRATKMSPMPWSKTFSTMTLESRQERMTAEGC